MFNNPFFCFNFDAGQTGPGQEGVSIKNQESGEYKDQKDP